MKTNGSPALPSRYPENIRAIYRVFATHGGPLRGLMSTPKSPNFQGRFGRMFHKLPAATYGKTDDESRAALVALGQEMTAGFDRPKDGFDAEESGIPALYTYFGQFIDHDITFDPMTTLIKRSDPDALTDFRTPALDLDNVYGRGPSDQPYMYDGNGVKFLTGLSISPKSQDLPRSASTPARAIIGDPRNDENNIVSQFQGLMLSFHNRLVDEQPGLEFPEYQRQVRWHYQYVVVNDFLSRIVSPAVLEDLKTDKKFDKDKLRFFVWKNDPFMPIEFSVAAYRLGHSMVRPGYRLNDKDGSLLPIMPVPPQGLTDSLSGFDSIRAERAIDWGRFIDLKGDVREYGEDPDKVSSPTDAMRRRLQFAYRIDTSVVNPLAFLPHRTAPDSPSSLAQRNLIRGFELGLPSGQDVARSMGITPLSKEDILIGKAVDDTHSSDFGKPISEFPNLSAFSEKCPLWTYVLAEARHWTTSMDIQVTGGMKINTPQLGPVGGRIVAEVFLGLMFGDSDSYLSTDPNWVPTLGSAGAAFRLRDLVDYALGN